MKGLYGSIGHALNKSNSNAAVPNIPPSSHSKVRPVNTYGDLSGLSERAGGQGRTDNSG